MSGLPLSVDRRGSSFLWLDRFVVDVNELSRDKDEISPRISSSAPSGPLFPTFGVDGARRPRAFLLHITVGESVVALTQKMAFQFQLFEPPRRTAIGQKRVRAHDISRNFRKASGPVGDRRNRSRETHRQPTLHRAVKSPPPSRLGQFLDEFRFFFFVPHGLAEICRKPLVPAAAWKLHESNPGPLRINV